MVITTSAARTASSVSGLGNSCDTSIPISFMASTTAGFNRSAGVEPADRTVMRPAARWLSRAAAIWLRPALWTQTNRTSGISHRLSTMIDMRDNCCSPDPASAPVIGSREDEAELAAMAKALGHPMRVRILRILAERQACLCGELVDELPISQATVSEHLRVLKEAGLVQGEMDGPRVCYSASGDRLARLQELFSLLRQPTPTTEALPA